jgi:histone H3/H4
MSDVDESEKKLTKLPIARVKRLMKTIPECPNLSVESVFLVTLAAELFTEHLAGKASKKLKHEKATLKYDDLGTLIRLPPALLTCSSCNCARQLIFVLFGWYPSKSFTCGLKVTPVQILFRSGLLSNK